MIKILLVGAGGRIGAVSRYSVGMLAARLSNGHWFPYGTFAVNAIGCFLIGFIIAVGEGKGFLNDNLHLFLIVGLLGGFTTFSSFSHETAVLFRNTQTIAALLNIFLQLAVCFIAVGLGHFLGKSF